VTKSTVKFVIVGTQRTGTTLIRTSLSSHPDIHCAGEAFKLGKRPYRQTDGYWHYSRQSLSRRIKSLILPKLSAAAYLDELYSDGDFAASGFKLMLSHCKARPYLWPLLKEHNVKAILVRRVNPIKTLVSRRTAAKSGVYHVSGPHKSTTIRIDTESLVADLDEIENEAPTWRKKLGDATEYLDIAYEDYLLDQPGTNEKILDFLGVPQAILTSKLKKINPDDLRMLIENFEEFVTALENTKYAVYLDPK
jgi:LPS sulfotransferase NodH